MLGLQKISEVFKSPKEKYDEENFISGELRPLPIKTQDSISFSEASQTYTFKGITEKAPEIYGIVIKKFKSLRRITFKIVTDSYGITTNQLSKGFNILNFVKKDQIEFECIVGVDNNERLYVSLEFKDLEKEETIGFINFNKWKLYKPNLFYFQNDDYRLEVRDKQNHIVLALKYNQSETDPTIEIAGYFIGPTGCLVIPNDPQDQSLGVGFFIKDQSDWKQKAIMILTHVKSIF